MQTLSSASRTCIASSSAVEWTATVAMPSSLQARSTRSAISPRLAMRILSNTPLLDDHQRFAVFHRLAVFNEDLKHRAGARRGNLIHRLHRLDDDERLTGLHLAADFDKGPRAGRGAEIGSSDHWRGDETGMLPRIGRYCRWDRHRHGKRRVHAPHPSGVPGRVPGNADRYAIAFEFDLVETCFVEQLRQFADHVVIDGRRWCRRRAPGLARHDYTFAPIIAARPSIASA